MVIAYVDPKPAGFRLFISRCEHGDRRVVRMYLDASHRIATQRFNQRIHQCFTLTDPSTHAGRVQLDPVACGDLRLPVERLMIGVLRHEDVGKQARVCDAALNRQARGRRLRNPMTAGADLLAPDGADDLKGRHDAPELFGHVFAQRLHLAAAFGTTRPGFQHVFFARQVLRKCFARGALAFSRR